jgi:hypothetical protein
VSLARRLMRAQEIALCVVRKWWRPLTCAGIAASMWTHGVIVPILTKTSTDLTGLSLLVTAAAAAFAVREVGKIMGNSDDNA